MWVAPEADSQGSASSAATVLVEKTAAQVGHADHDSATAHCLPRDVTPVHYFFPHRQPWAGCAPTLKDLGIGPRLLCYPLDEVQHERMQRVSHDQFLTSRQRRLCVTGGERLHGAHNRPR